jgi:hypothetical protein
LKKSNNKNLIEHEEEHEHKHEHEINELDDLGYSEDYNPLSR